MKIIIKVYFHYTLKILLKLKKINKINLQINKWIKNNNFQDLFHKSKFILKMNNKLIKMIKIINTPEYLKIKIQQNRINYKKNK